MRVLVVEDNALIALDLEQMVAKAGYAVVGVATTTREALAFAGEQNPDLILMDISLADGSCGVDAAALLKEQFGIPSMFVSAALPDRPEVRQAGVGHLTKPCKEEEVIAAIQAVEAVIRGETPLSIPSRFQLFA